MYPERSIMKRRITAFILIQVLILSLCACRNADRSVIPGTGVPGVPGVPEWDAYDSLLKEASVEADVEKRSLLMHQAEDMLMDTGAVIPLYHASWYYMAPENVRNVYLTPGNILWIRGMEVAGQDGSVPVKVCVCTEIPSLDPLGTQAADLSQMTAIISAGLLMYDQNGDIVEDLAESYQVSDDGLTYTFRLRDGLRWSDGTRLSAEDFVYTWKYAASTERGSEVGPMFEVIKGYPDDLCVSASPDGKVFTVELENPCTYFTSLCTFSAFTPLQKKQIEEAPGYRDGSGRIVNASAWATEAGFASCGAYTCESWKHNESIVLKKNPYFYDADHVKTEKLEMMLSSDSTIAYSAYQSGDITVLLRNVPADILPSLFDSPEFHSKSSLSTYYFLFNVNSDLFDGMTAEEAATFRKAVGMCFDRQFIVDVGLQNGSVPAVTYLPPNINDGTGNPFEYENKGYYDIRPDLPGARELLKSIGFEFNSEGKLKKPICLEYLSPGTAANSSVAACLQADLAEIGINMTVNAMEWAVYLGEKKNPENECLYGAWIADYDDPYGMLFLFTTDAAMNDASLGLEIK